jgi:hypothetical protein
MERDPARRRDAAREAASSRPAESRAASLAPEHDWSAAARLLHPVLRPVGTTGVDGHNIGLSSGSGLPGKPLISSGPAGLAVAYVIPGQGFSIFAGAEHLQAWGVGPEKAHAAATANLSAWSAGAPWDEDVSGPRRVVWSASGRGMDAARILLPEVRAWLTAELGGSGRVLVGLPEGDLLVAASLLDQDDEFAALFAEYVADRSAEADDPLDPRLFELVGGELVAFAGGDAA